MLSAAHLFHPSTIIFQHNHRAHWCICPILGNSVAPELEGSSPHSQQPASDPYPEPGESTPHPPPQPISLRPILIPSSYLRLGLPSGLFPSGFPIKTCTRFSPLPRVPHALPTYSPWFALPLMLETKSHTHTKQLAELWFVSSWH
jgi:hypothetical protein